MLSNIPIDLIKIDLIRNKIYAFDFYNVLLLNYNQELRVFLMTFIQNISTVKTGGGYYFCSICHFAFYSERYILPASSLNE